MLVACPILDAFITWIPADEELLCGNATVFVVVVVVVVVDDDVIVIVVIITIIIKFPSYTISLFPYQSINQSINRLYLGKFIITANWGHYNISK